MPDQHCFHCGLPIVEKKPPSLEVEERTRYFCCHGCKAVCDAIVSSGNADYYKHRQGKARTINSADMPEFLDKLKLYDNEEIQRDFVRTGKISKKSKSGESSWKEAWLILEEIRCAACMWLNERTLRNLEGVLDVQMDYSGQQARVRWDPEKIKLSEILMAISQIGYVAHPFDPSQRESLNREQKQRSLQRIIFALILGMAVMQSAIGSYFMGAPDSQGEYPLWIKISRWVNVFSTLLILAYPGQLFFRNAWRDLKNKSLGMDVPVVIGLSVAWLGSLYSTIRREGDVYFESIAMFVLFLLIARYIELRTRMTASALLDRSAKIIPQTAKLLTQPFAQKIVKEIPVIELRKGDRIQVSPGETLPVDARLLSENSSFDESLLTGESLPVVHKKGDKILGGSINVEQVIEAEVVSGSLDSTLNEIYQLTQRSVNYRPYYVDLAEKVAAKFVAVILLIAALTYTFWILKGSPEALSHTISVLIVTCPCALALAAPVALSLGAAGLSRLHLLAVRMSSIEKLEYVDTIVFDKTGTLTMGEPKLECIKTTATLNENQCLAIAASMEQGSQHPFAKALLNAKANLHVEKDNQPSVPDLDTKELRQYTGQGVEMKSGQNTWRLGNNGFVLNTEFVDEKDHLEIKEGGIDTASNDDLAAQISEWRNRGFSILYLANQHKLQAIFCIIDPLRVGMRSFLRQCDELGIHRKVILSGDHQQSVDAVARQLEISDALGSLSPQQKLTWIQKLQNLEPAQHPQQNIKRTTNHKVMMVGDGVNDAPTLAAADVSLTFSDATDLARSNCDFILLGKDYSQLGNAFSLMRKTRRIILQNLGWAIAYNVIAVPAAALGWVTPWMAAIGMSVSSLIVVLNSLRLKNGRSNWSARLSIP